VRAHPTSVVGLVEASWVTRFQKCGEISILLRENGIRGWAVLGVGRQFSLIQTEAEIPSKPGLPGQTHRAKWLSGSGTALLFRMSRRRGYMSDIRHRLSPGRSLEVTAHLVLVAWEARNVCSPNCLESVRGGFAAVVGRTRVGQHDHTRRMLG